jgi:hypothetical protein
MHAARCHRDIDAAPSRRIRIDGLFAPMPSNRYRLL